MPKKRTITLAITKPCKVGWDKMTPTEKGKHCAHCNKTVTDFTNYTDKELVDFFKHAKGSVCGRFEPYQMNRALPLAEANSNSFIYKAIFGSAIAASIVTAVNGQDVNQNANTIGAGTTENHPTIKIEKKHPVALRYIKGKVIDSKTKVSIGEGAAVYIKGTNLSTTTDMYGAFVIPAPDSILSKKIILVAECYDHKRKRTTISAGDYMDFLTITLKPVLFKPRARTAVYGQVTRFL